MKLYKLYKLITSYRHTYNKNIYSLFSISNKESLTQKLTHLRHLLRPIVIGWQLLLWTTISHSFNFQRFLLYFQRSDIFLPSILSLT